MLGRRMFTAGAAATGVMLMMDKAHGAAAASPASAPLEVSGPITGGDRGHVFGGYAGDLSAVGYEEVEYFVSGQARRYHLQGEMTLDGRWSAAAGEAAPFKTRIVLHRPKEPSRFNGVVVCEWTNVSAGYEISTAVNEGFFNEGFAYAAISAQVVGLEGGGQGENFGLKAWDPAAMAR